jgi:hypothetical protein
MVMPVCPDENGRYAQQCAYGKRHALVVCKRLISPAHKTPIPHTYTKHAFASLVATLSYSAPAGKKNLEMTSAILT